MSERLHRQAEPELMDEADEALAYAAADFAEVNSAFVERLCGLAPDRAGAVALDLGTGPADIPARLAGRKPGWRIIAADASRAMLLHGKALLSRTGAGVRLVMADAKRLPFRNACMDIVFSNSILHHINETARLWNEIRRVARPGALVFLRDLARPRCASDALDIVRKHAGNESALLREEYYRSLLAAYTEEEIVEQLDRAGLDGFEVRMVTDRHVDIWGEIPPA